MMDEPSIIVFLPFIIPPLAQPLPLQGFVPLSPLLPMPM